MQCSTESCRDPVSISIGLGTTNTNKLSHTLCHDSINIENRFHHDIAKASKAVVGMMQRPEALHATSFVPLTAGDVAVAELCFPRVCLVNVP
jgi:hypothetical protein